MNLPRTLSLLKKSARGVFFFLKGWNCVPLAKGPKIGTDGNFAVSNYSLNVACRRGLCSTDCKFSRGGSKKDANLSMDDLLISNKKNGFPWRSSCGVWAALHQVLQVVLGNSGPGQWPNKLCVGGTCWNLWTIVLTFCVSTTWICIKYCVHVPVQLLGM